MAPCPGTPNCVRTSQTRILRQPGAANGPPHLVLRDSGEATWTRLVDLVASMPRTKVLTTTDRYVHAEARTVFFRFVDDLELLWLPEAGHVQVRSASRLGAGDMGVNARRLERLRSLAEEAGLTAPAD